MRYWTCTAGCGVEGAISKRGEGSSMDIQNADKMEIQNSLRFTLMEAEGMWTPEKGVVTWRNSFIFQIGKQMHLFGFCTVYPDCPVQCPEYWNLFLVLMWGWEYWDSPRSRSCPLVAPHLEVKYRCKPACSLKNPWLPVLHPAVMNCRAQMWSQPAKANGLGIACLCCTPWPSGLVCD